MSIQEGKIDFENIIVVVTTSTQLKDFTACSHFKQFSFVL